jgi:PAS domain S-box-containing protein
MRAPHPNPLRREGLTRRVAPFAAVTLFVLALIAAPPGDVDSTWALVVAGVLTVVIVTSPWWVPWERLPRSAQAVPPIAYFLVIALLREAEGGADSVYAPLVALPVLWLALWGTRGELLLGVVGAALVFAVPPVLASSDRYPDSELARGLVWGGVSLLLGLAIQRLVAGALGQADRATQQASVLERSEQRLRNIIDTAHEAFVSIDESGRIIEWNPQAERTFGWARDEVLGRELAETIIPPEYRDEHRRGLARFVQTGEGPVLDKLLELTALRRDGETFPVDLTISAVSTTEGHVFHAFVRDISDRKRAERYFAAQHSVTRVLAESRTSGEAMEGVMETLGEAIESEVGTFWTIDRAKNVLELECVWHRPGLDASEVSRFEGLSRRVTFAPGVGLPGQAWADASTQRADDVLEDPSFLRYEAARALGLHAAIALPVTSGGRVTGIIEFFSSGVGTVDDELVEGIAVLGAQVGEFLERKRAEETADRIKDEFFTLVSHEFRTPLTSIIGYLELLLEDESDQLPFEDRRRFLEVVKRNSARLMRLVEDLLFVNKVQSGDFLLRNQRVDVEALAEACIEAALPYASENGIRLDQKSNGPTVIWGDPDRLAQLLDNLVSNAVKYTPPGEHVQVRLMDGDRHVLLEVQNTGTYVSPEERERLFERFFRTEAAVRSKAPGIGLGLTITQAIVAAHEGRIGVESSEAEGTIFRVELPRGIEPDKADAAVSDIRL